jgi:hypothetical protein
VTTVNQDLWEVASVIAMLRLGLHPLRKVDGKHVSPKKDLDALPADESRRLRRKYRKIWRRALMRDLREFEKLPKRQQVKQFSWCGEYIKGRYVDNDDDPLMSMMLQIAKYEVGEKPSPWARGYRWALVKSTPEFERELLRAGRRRCRRTVP